MVFSINTPVNKDTSAFENNKKNNFVSNFAFILDRKRTFGNVCVSILNFFLEMECSKIIHTNINNYYIDFDRVPTKKLF